MKITDTTTGKALQLSVDTQLEAERPNLFFNEYGEQTLPADIPDTDVNREISGYTDKVANKARPSAALECSIADGDYFMHARMSVLSAKRKDKISVSFYMNEGSFLSKVGDASLADVFGDETIPGVSTVEQGIDFCRSLTAGTNTDFAIFPILIDGEGSLDSLSSITTGTYPVYKWINRFGHFNAQAIPQWIDGRGASNDFYNAVARTEQAGEVTLNLSPGFYMSPFFRANYLLKRILLHFGYTLSDNFFTTTYPFMDMVIVNTCADALVNGTIKLTDLLPDCTCADILNLFRKKFCCEFIPDESTRTVDIKLLSEILDSDPQIDLDGIAASYPEVSFPAAYKRITLESEDKLSDDASVDESDSLLSLKSAYKNLHFNILEGAIYRYGYLYKSELIAPGILKSKEIVAYPSLKYSTGDMNEKQEVSVPDIALEYRRVYTNYPYSYDSLVIYAGQGRWMNSKVTDLSSNSNDTVESSTDNKAQKPMLAFFYNNQNNPQGLITNYANIIPESRWETVAVPEEFFNITRISDYSLSYIGADGLFERFYRPLDALYRNSLHTVKVDVLEDAKLRQSLNAHLPVSLNSQKLLVNNFKYVIGGKAVNRTEIELLTMRLYEPVSQSPAFTDYINPETYGWEAHTSMTDLTESAYESSAYKDKTFSIFYPRAATAADVGQICFLGISAQKIEVETTYYKEFRFWLTAVAL
jgi:hypothetical protein